MKTWQSGKASEKVLAVLEALVMDRRMGEIAASTGLPKPTVHRSLPIMVREDFATIDDSEGYFPARASLDQLAALSDGWLFPQGVRPPVDCHGTPVRLVSSATNQALVKTIDGIVQIVFTTQGHGFPYNRSREGAH